MPPRVQPKVFQVLVKTHKLTVLTTIAPTKSVGELKTEILSALTSEVNTDPDVPRVSRTRDFELCKAVRERARLTGAYTALEDERKSLKDAGVTNWEPLFVRFRDPESGELQPVAFVPFEDDEDEVSQQFTSAPAPAPTPSSPAVETSTRGKRKTRPD